MVLTLSIIWRFFAFMCGVGITTRPAFNTPTPFPGSPPLRMAGREGDPGNEVVNTPGEHLKRRAKR